MNTTPLLELLSHTAMKGAAVLLVALLLGLILRKTAASRRYAIWLTAIAALAVLPLAMWALPAWRVLPKTSAGQEWPAFEPEVRTESEGAIVMATGNRVVSSAAKTVLQEPGPAAAPPSFSWKISWQDVVSKMPLVWMLIAGGFLLRLGLSAWRLHRLEATLTPGEFAVVAQTARELGLKRLPRLFVGPPDAVPMVWGVLWPRLLLPQGFESWSGEKQRGVLLHELAHLKRGDPLALWVAQWVKALHWFNPLAWLTLRQLRADQERACDDTVLRQGVRASDYAQSLLDLSRHNRLAPGLSLCALTITRCAPVEARVKAILDPSRRRDPLTVRWLAGLGGGALLITLPVAMLHAIEGTKLRGRILDRNGVVLAESTKEKVRVYPLKTLAAHVIGYTRLPDENNPQIFGGAGLEKQKDAALAAGEDVALALDARIQALAYRALKDGGVELGAAVVLDPRSGEILASVSLPSFDPNHFIPSISFNHWDRYLNDKDIPLLNRAVKGHVPGAAFIPLTALSGIAAGVGDSRFTCEGAVTYGGKTMHCWINRQSEGKHGTLGLSSALVASCSCFWYQYGNAAGIEQIEAMAHKIGFGGRYDLLEDESAGIVPSPSWLKQNHPKEQWSAGHTANASIGQGFMLASPLQLAVLAATVGNGGRAPQPGLLKNAGASGWRVDLTNEGLSVAQLESLREGMRLVVNGGQGTGRKARSERVEIAGQTGTAQNWRIVNGKRVESNHLWFIGFAPFEKPTLAFAILKQGGKSGGSDCAPVAKRIVEEALALPADGSGEVRPVEEPTNIEEGNRKAEVVPKPLETIKTTPAKVIDRSAETMFSSLMIDKGSLDGIVADSPVVTANGLVGKTATPEPHSTKVILLTDKLCFVSAKVQGGIEQGIVNGESAAHEARRQLRLRFLSRDAKINKGSSVYSSGEGGVFPAGLLLGRVELFKKGDFSGEATVEPAVDFSTLDLVFVIETKTKPAGEETTPSPQPDGQVQIRQQSDADIRMKPELAKQWAALKRAGLLADLPASARPFDLGGKHPERQVKSVVEFRFWTSRADVRRWLVDSHCFPAKADPLASRHSLLWEPPAVEDIAADWPAPPEPFRRTYAAAAHCEVDIHTSDGENFIVTVRQMRFSILIAPDESQEPRPAGRLEPERVGEARSAEAKPLPALDRELQTLRATISPEQEQRLQPSSVYFTQPLRIDVRPSDREMILPVASQYLTDGLSEESAREVSRISMGRQSMALLVKTPQPH